MKLLRLRVSIVRAVAEETRTPSEHQRKQTLHKEVHSGGNPGTATATVVITEPPCRPHLLELSLLLLKSNQV